ncbi:MAG TPA: bifunctional transaldolase/phosoglucose isomerase [Candidatus Acidoferrales bacterium]|nr:bifunctional transaldolase/phosoglucose isomerase [Candidatus Acidoferrales bacterium]
MKKNPLKQVIEFGQSIWLDQIQRSMFRTGELRRFIAEDGLRGMTSNPTIFEKAIATSSDYNEQITKLAVNGAKCGDIYDAIVFEDIGHAADEFRTVYEETEGLDGYVSLEVSPFLAHDTQRTLDEARRLFKALNRPNVMIKIPATPEGLPAIEQAISEGINVNVTLIFAVDVYEKVAEAYIRGLEKRVAQGKPVDRIASVASFFVSRIDSAVDKLLEDKIKTENDPARKKKLESLLGKAAIANAQLAYDSFLRIFNGERFEGLAASKARVQRPLWASTSTKNPTYPDVYYVEALMGNDTVNTLPMATLEAYRDHGNPASRLVEGMDKANVVFGDLADVGVDMKAVTDKLTADGVKSFADSFKQLGDVIELRREVAAARSLERHNIKLAGHEQAFDAAMAELKKNSAAARIWKKDPTLWTSDPDGQKIIANSLGWLNVIATMQERVGEIKAFAEEIRTVGFEHVVVLGMGGSSLCPEVLSRTFGKKQGWPQLHVVDSTVPATVLRIERKLNLSKTLFIVASKSGTTTEPVMFHRYFYDRIRQIAGGNAGRHFIAITDPGTQMVKDAERDGFRKVFLNMPDIGGRYSALSYFGMLPFALAGGDVEELLKRAHTAFSACQPMLPGAENLGLRIGAAIGAFAREGRDKVTLIAEEPIDSVGLWIEQLIAESTGKIGKGIVPVAGEPLYDLSQYGNDRVFVYLGTHAPDAATESKLDALEKCGHPVLVHILRDPLDLGEEFFLWEFATAVAGAVIGVNPFDQPNVQESKDNTKRLLNDYVREHKLATLTQIARQGELTVSSDEANAAALKNGNDVSAVIADHLARLKPGDYLALTEYIDETPEHDALITKIRAAISQHTRNATTTGYGPRFLHSTGQLHKGGADNGVFIQITAADPEDAPIVNEPYGFSVLKAAQALGDFESLSKRGRRAIRFDLGNDVIAGLERLLAAVQAGVPATK